MVPIHTVRGAPFFALVDIRAGLACDAAMMDDDELKKTFDLFDKDGDGCITTAEVRAMLTSLGDDLTDDEVTEIVRDADENGDGVVSFEEFVAAMGK